MSGLRRGDWAVNLSGERVPVAPGSALPWVPACALMSYNGGLGAVCWLAAR